MRRGRATAFRAGAGLAVPAREPGSRRHVVGSRFEVRVVGDKVEISRASSLTAKQAARHDRSKGRGVFATPTGRPRRRNAADDSRIEDVTHVLEPLRKAGGETRHDSGGGPQAAAPSGCVRARRGGRGQVSSAHDLRRDRLQHVRHADDPRREIFCSQGSMAWSWATVPSACHVSPAMAANCCITSTLLKSMTWP